MALVFHLLKSIIHTKFRITLCNSYSFINFLKQNIAQTSKIFKCTFTDVARPLIPNPKSICHNYTYVSIFLDGTQNIFKIALKHNYLK